MKTITAEQSKLLVLKVLNNFESGNKELVHDEIIVNEDNGNYPTAFKVWINRDYSNGGKLIDNRVSFWTLSMVFDEKIARSMHFTQLFIDSNELREKYEKEDSTENLHVFVGDEIEITESSFSRPTDEYISNFMKKDYKRFFKQNLLSLLGTNLVGSSDFKISQSQLVASRMGYDIDTIFKVSDSLEREIIKGVDNLNSFRNAAILSVVSFLAGVGASIIVPIWGISKLIRNLQQED